MKNEMTIVWNIKKNVSTNDYYKSHWSKRTKMKESIIFNLVKENSFRIKGQYEIRVLVNNRLDIDNNSAAIKVIIDHIRSIGWIVDDDPRYFKKLTIETSSDIKRNTMVLTIEEV